MIYLKPENFVCQGGRILKTIISKSLCTAFIAATTFSISIATFAGSAQAQDENAAGLVAVLDVAKVFKENRAFETRMATIKSEADALKSQLEQQQQSIQTEAQSLGQYEVGTAERNQLEALLEQKQTSLRTKARQAEADLLNREAKIYHETYQQMQSVVGNIANQHGIALVIRFDSEDIDSTNRAEVIKGVNRPVVFHRRLDLTTMVISQMNPAQAAAPTGTVPR